MASRDKSLYYTVGFGVLVIGLTVGQQLLSKSSSLPAEGKPAPEFSVRRVTGETVSLGELRGKVVLVDFWARWCDPCVEMMRPLDNLARRMAGKPFELLSVNIEAAPPKRIDQWIKSRGYGFVGAQDVDGTAKRAYRFDAIPHLVLIDADGVLRKRYSTDATEARLPKDVSAPLPASV